jgi:hypothetical protein
VINAVAVGGGAMISDTLAPTRTARQSPLGVRVWFGPPKNDDCAIVTGVYKCRVQMMPSKFLRVSTSTTSFGMLRRHIHFSSKSSSLSYPVTVVGTLGNLPLSSDNVGTKLTSVVCSVTRESPSERKRSIVRETSVVDKLRPRR